MKSKVSGSHFVGNYRLGFKWVRLFADNSESGGSVKLIPEDEGSAVVTVGLHGPWEIVFSTLLHELYEAAMIDMGVRYGVSPAMSCESSDFLFVMTHNQLDEAHSRVSGMLIDALPAMAKLYKKYSTWED